MNGFIEYSSRRSHCPSCESSDGFAEILRYGNDNVEGRGYGKCFSCDFLFTPKIERQMMRGQGRPAQPLSVRTTTSTKAQSIERKYISDSVFLNTQQYQQTNNFALFYVNLFGELFRNHLAMWRVGGDEFGGVVFHYFTYDGLHSTLKTMPYNATTGKRVRGGLERMDYKTGSAIKVDAMNALRVRGHEYNTIQFDWYTHKQGYQMCIYGEQWLPERPQDTVVVVESEKSALLGSFFFPQYCWLACGGTNGLTKEKARVLENRTVLVCFDCDGKAIERAQTLVTILHSIGAKATADIDGVPMQTALFGVDAAKGYDIADWICEAFREGLLALPFHSEVNAKMSILPLSKTLPSWLDCYEFEERAAILEYDGGMTRAVAEQRALVELKKLYEQ